MSRFSSGYRATGAGSTTLPMASLYAGSAGRPRLIEVGCFNTTATALAMGLARLSTAGTSSAVTPTYEDDDTKTATATPRNVHSSTAPTLGAFTRQTTLGAAIGSGVIWTFSGTGMVIPTGVGNGIGLIVPTGTGQICDVYWVWEE